MLVLAAVGCGDSGTNAPRCVPGATNGCLCVGGGTGVQLCTTAGTYGSCVCGSSPDASASSDVTTANDSSTTLPDVSMSGDASSPSDTPAVGDVSSPSSDGSTLVDVLTVTDVPTSDAVARDVTTIDSSVVDAPTSDVVPSDGGVRPDVTTGCGSPPTTAVMPTVVRFPALTTTGSPFSVAFSESGLMGVAVGNVSRDDFGYIQAVTSDGFSRWYATPLNYISATDFRFVSETRVFYWYKSSSITTPVFGLFADATGTAPGGRFMSTSIRTAIAVDREGGAFYTDGSLLFRMTAGTVGPGDLVARNLPGVDSLLLTPDGSALFYVSTSSPAGIYRLPLSRDSLGVITGGTPTMYFAADSVAGTLSGIALDVCGNLYSADTRTHYIWRIPPGPTPGTAGTRAVVVVSGHAGRPFFGVGGWDPTRLYFVEDMSFGAGSRSTELYSAPVGIAGIRQ